MESRVPFFITNAFTNQPFGGNPAAIIFLDNDLPTTTLLEIAKNLNQPIATFILPSTTRGDARTKQFRVRWFTTVVEIGLCGHGTLAAAGTIFATQDPAANLNTLNFETTDGRVVSARRVGDRVEISLTSATMEQPDIETQQKLESIVRCGLQKDDISVHFVGVGRKGFEQFLMVEIDVKDDLANCDVDSTAFVSTSEALIMIPKFLPGVTARNGIYDERDHICLAATRNRVRLAYVCPRVESERGPCVWLCTLPLGTVLVPEARCRTKRNDASKTSEREGRGLDSSLERSRG